MNYVLIGGAALIGVLVLYQLLRKTEVRRLIDGLRWIVGGAAALLAVFLMLRGQVGIASLVGFGAYSILHLGRLGPIVFDTGGIGEANESVVKSRYFAMTLDHASGAVAGRVTSGSFAGADLIDLGEDDTRRLLDEVASDPDSLALLETWLDRNRAGWREYFAETAAPGDAGEIDEDQQAYEVLGLRPGATADEIHAAHRRLMKGVHPDRGGSTYLAAKINAAKDRLLKKQAAGR
ncbi:MAG: DnaJ domain-containing protein [Devosia sp.]|nr:DnaJ domain-containing protein [Devosia sp.]